MLRKKKVTNNNSKGVRWGKNGDGKWRGRDDGLNEKGPTNKIYASTNKI